MRHIILLAFLAFSNVEAFQKVQPSLVETGNNPLVDTVVQRIPRGGARAFKKPIGALQTTTEGASIPNEVFNLVKGIVGVGVLSLPAGMYTARKTLLFLWYTQNCVG
jgi:hypothetical protein